jgi:hypothetical protein
MKWNRYLILILLISIIITSVIGCKAQEAKENSYEENRFYMITGDSISLTYNDDYSHSFYYKVDKKYKIRLELIIKEKGKIIDRMEIEDIKEDIADIDGTFGLSVDRDKDNNKIIWTIRHDETTKKIETSDLLLNVKGNLGTICDSGILGEGVIAIDNQYDIIENEEREYKNNQYDWGMEFKVYGTYIKDENESYIGN